MNEETANWSLTRKNDVKDINSQCFSREKNIGNLWDQTSLTSWHQKRSKKMYFIKARKTENGKFHVTVDAVVAPDGVQHLADAITGLIENIEPEEA